MKIIFQNINSEYYENNIIFRFGYSEGQTAGGCPRRNCISVCVCVYVCVCVCVCVCYSGAHYCCARLYNVKIKTSRNTQNIWNYFKMELMCTFVSVHISN
jgi:hypothetical protein